MNQSLIYIQDVATLRELCGDHHPHTPYKVQNHLNAQAQHFIRRSPFVLFSTINQVDDEPTITRMVQMMLGPYQHEITLASSGEEALDRLAEASFDLVLSDLGLGDGMNGWELLDRVRERAPGTRFILSTGWGAQIDPSEVVARGGEGLLSKPYRLADLLRAIAGAG